MNPSPPDPLRPTAAPAASPSTPRAPLDNPWEAWQALARYFHLCDRVLTTALPPLERALALASLAHRHHHPSQTPPSPPQVTGLREAFLASEVRVLSVQTRTLLLFVTGAALALRETRPDEARALLHEAVLLARFTWSPSPWQPWQGPAPRWVPRRPVALLREDDAQLERLRADPSGDPLEPLSPGTLEPLCTRGLELLEPVPVRQILEGLLVWEAVVQSRLAWPLGSMTLTGRPDLNGLLQERHRMPPEPEMLPPAELLDWFSAVLRA